MSVSYWLPRNLHTGYEGSAQVEEKLVRFSERFPRHNDPEFRKKFQELADSQELAEVKELVLQAPQECWPNNPHTLANNQIFVLWAFMVGKYISVRRNIR